MAKGKRKALPAQEKKQREWREAGIEHDVKNVDGAIASIRADLNANTKPLIDSLTARAKAIKDEKARWAMVASVETASDYMEFEHAGGEAIKTLEYFKKQIREFGGSNSVPNHDAQMHAYWDLMASPPAKLEALDHALKKYEETGDLAQLLIHGAKHMPGQVVALCLDMVDIKRLPINDLHRFKWGIDAKRQEAANALFSNPHTALSLLRPEVWPKNINISVDQIEAMNSSHALVKKFLSLKKAVDREVSRREKAYERQVEKYAGAPPEKIGAALLEMSLEQDREKAAGTHNDERGNILWSKLYGHYKRAMDRKGEELSTMLGLELGEKLGKGELTLEQLRQIHKDVRLGELDARKRYLRHIEEKVARLDEEKKSFEGQGFMMHPMFISRIANERVEDHEHTLIGIREGVIGRFIKRLEGEEAMKRPIAGALPPAPPHAVVGSSDKAYQELVAREYEIETKLSPWLTYNGPGKPNELERFQAEKELGIPHTDEERLALEKELKEIHGQMNEDFYALLSHIRNSYPTPEHWNKRLDELERMLVRRGLDRVESTEERELRQWLDSHTFSRVVDIDRGLPFVIGREIGERQMKLKDVVARRKQEEAKLAKMEDEFRVPDLLESPPLEEHSAKSYEELIAKRAERLRKYQIWPQEAVVRAWRNVEKIKRLGPRARLEKGEYTKLIEGLYSN